MKSEIISYCKIKNNTVWVNDKLLHTASPAEDFSIFAGALYKYTDLNYPKFFKMDKLCKLGILATEIMLREIKNFDTFPKNEIALVFANASSSIDSDRNHANTIADKQNYFPSPSVFVYTLPNIVIGEIAIKHKITGENAFFVSRQFDENIMHAYCDILLSGKNTTAAVCGWVNLDGPEAEAFVYCVKNLNFKQESNDLKKIHNSKNIQHLYSL